MSGDELFVLIVSAVIGSLGWKPWLGGLFLWSVQRKGSAFLQSILFPFVSALAVLFVLRTWSAHDVRDNGVYVFFYFVLWFGWMGAMNWLIAFACLSCRDDVLEGGNTAAGLAVGGALLGLTLAFAGGNIGDGPGWWVVVFSAGLGSASLVGLWVAGCVISRVADTITIDRDTAAGWRALGFFVAGGLVLGRAVAGDWHSALQTVADFIGKSWLLTPLWGVCVVMDSVWRPTPLRPSPDCVVCGLLPCVFYIAAGVGIVVLQGPWK